MLFNRMLVLGVFLGGLIGSHYKKKKKKVSCKISYLFYHLIHLRGLVNIYVELCTLETHTEVILTEPWHNQKCIFSAGPVQLEYSASLSRLPEGTIASYSEQMQKSVLFFQQACLLLEKEKTEMFAFVQPHPWLCCCFETISQAWFSGGQVPTKVFPLLFCSFVPLNAALPVVIESPSRGTQQAFFFFISEMWLNYCYWSLAVQENTLKLPLQSDPRAASLWFEFLLGFKIMAFIKSISVTQIKMSTGSG